MLKNDEVLLIAGEKSGEEHALSFVPELIKRFPSIRFYGVGGESLESLGMDLLYHLKDFSSWGFTEVIGKIPFYFNALKKIESEVITRKTKVAILIDFQDFNLRLAKRLSKRGVKVLYYVAPQAWAWKAWRAGVLEECTHTLFTIIPFEEQWFKERGVKRVAGISHPLFHHYHKRINHERLGITSKNFDSFKSEVKLLLLPGSRNFEVSGLLNEYFEAIKLLKLKYNLKVGMVRSSNVKEDLYVPWIDKLDIVYESEELADALEWADFSLAASGTVTLACAMFQVPTIVCYTTSLLNEFIYHTFISYDGCISLANIVHQEILYPELVMNQATGFNMAYELEKWLTDSNLYNEVKFKLRSTVELVDKSGEDIPGLMGKVIEESYGKNAK
ncbi:MAG: lipid-A-disaccharide synthase [Bacteriovoracaceae bacterium]|nr:lipid-A-disaccharide synthase [Bacteriovoracaceae bacterium]